MCYHHSTEQFISRSSELVQKFISSQQELQPGQEAEKMLEMMEGQETEENWDTVVFPTVEMGPLGIRQDSEVLSSMH